MSTHPQKTILQALHQASIELFKKSLDEEDILTTVAKTIQEVLGFDRYRLYLFEEQKALLRQVREGGMAYASRYQGVGRSADGLMAELIRKGHRGQRSLHITNLQDTNQYPFIDHASMRHDIDKFGEDKVKEAFYLILTTGHTVIGIIAINNWERGNPLFSANQQEEMEALETFASQAAHAIDALRNYKFITQKRNQVDKLAAISMLSLSIVHKINNPLTAILFNGEIIRDMLQRSTTLREVFRDPTATKEQTTAAAQELENIEQHIEERIGNIERESKKTSRIIRQLAHVVDEAEEIIEEEPQGSAKVLDLEAMIEKIVSAGEASDR